MDGARAAPRRERAALLGWGQVGAAASREPAVVRLQGAWYVAGRPHCVARARSSLDRTRTCAVCGSVIDYEFREGKEEWIGRTRPRGVSPFVCDPLPDHLEQVTTRTSADFSVPACRGLS